MAIRIWNEARSQHPTPISWTWYVILAVLCLLPAIWAGDTAFISDEPQILRKALIANDRGIWAAVGLRGTAGWFYGPFPVWLYQVLLRVTTDLVDLVRIRAVLFMAVTLGSALHIARLVGFKAYWILLIAVAPYLLLYSRLLWDNSFNIPLASVAVALTLRVIIRDTLWPLPLLVLVTGAMVLTHLMSLALIAALILVLATGGWQALSGTPMRTRGFVLAASVAALLLVWRVSVDYRPILFHPIHYPIAVSTWPNPWWFALLSPRLLTATGIDFFFPAGYLRSAPFSPLLTLARIVTALNFALAWTGGVLAVYGLFARRDAVTLAGFLGVATVVSQTAMNVATHTFGLPHYYNATWIAPALLIGVALTWLGRWRGRVATAVGAAMVAALATSSIFVAVRLHLTGGTRQGPDPNVGNYGPTIANQIDVVRAGGVYGGRPSTGPTVSLFSESLEVIQRVEQLHAIHDSARPTTRPPATQPSRSPTKLQYVHPDDPWDGRIELDPAG